MFSDILDGAVERLFGNARARRALTAAVIVISIGLEVSGLLTAFQSVAALSLYALVYLDVVQSQTQEIETDLSTHDNRVRELLAGTDVFDAKSDAAANEALSGIIDDETPNRVVMIDYSSDRGRDLVHAAMNAGADVYLLVKHPGTAPPAGDRDWSGQAGTPVNDHQRSKILQQLTHERRLFSHDAVDPDRLHLKLYRPPAAVRARRIGENHVCVGWYRFGLKSRGEGIHGDDNPMFHLGRHNPNFNVVDDWLMEDVLPDLWNDAETLADVVEGEETPPELADWLATDETGEREAFVEATSTLRDHADPPAFVDASDSGRL